MPHDGPGEHYHDIGARVGGNDDAIVWTTVGLDIGSSTSQAVFSRITLARDDAYYVVVDRAILHQSDIILTPYATPELIDQRRLAAFVEGEFAAANLTRSEIHAGAVIMTGLALMTRNSRAIADIVADKSGTFVAVSAGDLLEARLAANGAGLPDLSMNHAGVILHIDIGGGTTKLSVWRDGKLQCLAAIDVGARLLSIDDRGLVAKIVAPLMRIAKRLHLDLQVGELLTSQVADALGSELSAEIMRCGRILPEPMQDPSLLRTAPLFPAGTSPDISAVIFSGGVSEYIYGRESREFGDLGMALGRAVRRAVNDSGIELLESERGIRATVLGASQHSMQLSGNTIFVSDPACLPVRNLPMVLTDVRLSGADLDPKVIEASLDDALHAHAVVGTGKSGLGIAIRWEGSPTYQRLRVVAEAIAGAVGRHLDDAVPCVVIVEGDVAGLLGAQLNRHFLGRRHVISLDGVHIHEFDHVDIGEFSQHSGALPIVVKSLVFAQSKEHSHVHP
jgi:ethanolamine utilization protein EutA